MEKHATHTTKHPIEEVEHKIENTKTLHEIRENLSVLLEKEKRYVNSFKFRHKITFAFIVFFAINLLWYGMWTIVSDIPILSNPVVALVLGAIILISTGYFYENMISSKLNRKHRKKKEELDAHDESEKKNS